METTVFSIPYSNPYFITQNVNDRQLAISRAVLSGLPYSHQSPVLISMSINSGSHTHNFSKANGVTFFKQTDLPISKHYERLVGVVPQKLFFLLRNKKKNTYLAGMRRMMNHMKSFLKVEFAKSLTTYYTTIT